MHSSLTWLSHDSVERDRTLRLIELFKESGTLDELGVGAIRDGFADALFPGTSTLHTRPRYLLFIPWLLARSASGLKDAAEGPERMRRNEVYLINALLAGGESEGVIGRDARARLKVMPSAMYGAAVSRYGIRTNGTSIAQFFRDAVDSVAWRKHQPDADDEGVVDRVLMPGLDPELAVSCPAPADLLTSTTFDLSHAEAAYLRDRIVGSVPDSLLAWLLSHKAVDNDASMVWQHSAREAFPASNSEIVEHARRFHHAWHGAPLLYNLLLAEKKQNDDLVEYYRSAIADWHGEVAGESVWDGWSRTEFWNVLHRANSNLRPATVAFMDAWLNGAERSHNIADETTLRELVATRERRLKGGRSRLVNQAALDNWSGGVGLGRLQYRWSYAQTMVSDIAAGLERDA